ncbi:hypothetical protein [Planococcus salinus]|uniref:Uncharacterized protein n=1 Tax=Planococcus salinus TaxID=1848460 RepID=A0A3M8PB40_9BACL|nr:hypothetical protein [Planococcus salinus]RNF40414.1 hypothetical protein EEX84_03025 [Planococcus salinus]
MVEEKGLATALFLMKNLIFFQSREEEQAAPFFIENHKIKWHKALNVLNYIRKILKKQFC